MLHFSELGGTRRALFLMSMNPLPGSAVELMEPTVLPAHGDQFYGWKLVNGEFARWRVLCANRAL